MKACKVLAVIAAIVLTSTYAQVASAQELGCPPGQEAIPAEPGQELHLSGRYVVQGQAPTSGNVLLCRLPASSATSSAAGIIALTVGLGSLGLALFAVGFVAFVRQARRPNSFVKPPTRN